MGAKNTAGGRSTNRERSAHDQVSTRTERRSERSKVFYNFPTTPPQQPATTVGARSSEIMGGRRRRRTNDYATTRCKELAGGSEGGEAEAAVRRNCGSGPPFRMAGTRVIRKKKSYALLSNLSIYFPCKSYQGEQNIKRRI